MKLNNSAMVRNVVIVVMVAVGMVGGWYTLKGQVADTAKVVAEIKYDTAKNVEGTLKSSVEQNKENISDCIKNIEVLRTNLQNIEKAQSELKREMRRSNEEIKDMIRLILQKLD